MTALTTTGTTTTTFILSEQTRHPLHLHLHKRLRQALQHWLPNFRNASSPRQHREQVQRPLRELTSSLTIEQIAALTEGLQALASSSPSEMWWVTVYLIDSTICSKWALFFLKMTLPRQGVRACNIWTDVKLLNRYSMVLYVCRGVRHDCGTTLNEATTIMGYWVWSTQRTCETFYFVGNGKGQSQESQLICNFGFTRLYLTSWRRARPRTLQRFNFVFGPYLMAFLVTMVISEYLPLFEWYYLGYGVSRLICTLKDSVPDGSLKRSNFV